jgi:NitT/TauT family transport system permease protein
VSTTATTTEPAGAATPRTARRRPPGSRERRRDRILAIATPILLLALWELAARAGWIDFRYFPAPTEIIGQGVKLTRDGMLTDQLLITLWRLVLGLLIGGVPAVLIGLAMGLYRPLRAMLDPLIAATYPIPRSALLPLIILVFGLGESSKVFMVALGTFYPIVINTAVGVTSIPRIYLDVAHNYGAKGFRLFRTVALPGALPMIMTGVRLSVGLALIMIVIAEMFGAEEGLGFMLWNSWQVFAIDTMYVGLLTIGILGYLVNLITVVAERRLVPWVGK